MPSPEPVVEATEPAPSEEEAVPMTPVVIAVEPMDARIQNGEEELGSPAVVPVPVGQTVELKIEREGYVSQLVVLDGSVTKKNISLVAEKRAVVPVKRSSTSSTTNAKTTSKQPAQQPKGGKTAIGGGEIVNPWSR
jgi:hypothetical protein